MALEYLSYGLNPVPISDGKIPARRKFSSEVMTEEEIKTFNFTMMGVATGITSAGLEAIDFDLKNSDEPAEVMKRFREKVPNELLKSLVAQQTKSGGYHLIYRCEVTEPSRKLAVNPEGEPVIETRGRDAFIKCYPSEGYKLIQGSFKDIPIITPRQRLQLLISCQLVNDYLAKGAYKKSKDNGYVERFPKYDSDPQIGIDLLVKHGWKVISKEGHKVMMERPGKDENSTSATYFTDLNFFYNYSSNTDFEERRPLNNHKLFIELECGGDWRKGYDTLSDRGYANDNWKKKMERETSPVTDKSSLDDMSFISDRALESTYIKQAMLNEIPLGLSTGWPKLDQHFRIKRNTLNIGLGFDGCGKSMFKISQACSDFVCNGAKTAFCMPENKTAMSRRRIIEALSGRPITYFKGRKEELKHFEDLAYDNFFIIKNEKHWTIAEVMEMGKKLVNERGVQTLVIDPYNFFKATNENMHSGNTEILSQLRVFAEKYCTVDLMAHPVTGATRKNKNAEGYMEPPDKYDIEGGGSFAYRVDDFYILHRITNHGNMSARNVMQFILGKLKESETGGSVHSASEYTQLTWDTRDGFTGYYDDLGINPMREYLNRKLTIPKGDPIFNV